MVDIVDLLTSLKSTTVESLNEADTRARLIDPVLEALGWSRESIRREPYAGWVDSKGYIDYLLSVEARSTYVIEAKRAGRTFDIPASLKRQRTTSFKKLQSTGSPDLAEALDQCLRYAQHTGALYACATNGLEWVFFKPNHPHRALPDARAVLFCGIDDILHSLDLFEDLLGHRGVEQGACEKELLGREIQVPSFAKRLRDALPYRRDFSLEEEDYSHVLDQMLHHYMLDLTSDDAFAKCYVAAKGNRGTFRSIGSVIKHQVDALAKNDAKAPAEFGTALLAQPSLPNLISGRTVILHGAIGAGKSSFLRSCEASLKEAGQLASAVWAKIDLLPFRDRPFEISDVNAVLGQLCTKIQDAVSGSTQEMSGKYDPDAWEHLRDIYNQELRRFQKGRFPNSTDADPVYLAAAQEYVWDLRSKDPQDHVVRVVRWLTSHCRLPVVIVLDNSDQLGIEYQEFLYKLAETFQRTTCAVTILVMRTEALESHRIREHAIASVAEQFVIQKAPLPVVLLRRFELIDASISELATADNQYKVAHERMSVLMDTLNYEAEVGSDTFRIVDAAGSGSLRDALRAVAAIFRSSPRLMDTLVANQAKTGRARLRAARALRAMIKDDLVSGEHTKLVPNVFMVEGQVTVPYALAIRMMQQIKSKTAIGEYSVASLLNDLSVAGIDRGIALRVLTRLRGDRFVAVPHMLKEMRDVDSLSVTLLGDVMVDVILRLHDYWDAMSFETFIYDRDVYSHLTGSSATLLMRGSDQSDWSRFAGGGSTANRSRRPSRRRSRRLIRSQASRRASVTSGSRKFS